MTIFGQCHNVLNNKKSELIHFFFFANTLYFDGFQYYNASNKTVY